MAHGLGGQVIHVVPTHDLVIVIATEFDERDPARMITTLSRDADERLTDLAVIPTGPGDQHISSRHLDCL